MVDSTPFLRLWVTLARAFRAVVAAAEADAARHGLTLAEFGTLEALFHRGPLRLGELQEKVLVTSGGMTWVINRLVARELVRRRISPDDRRARYAELTPAGERLMREIFPAHAEAIHHTTSGLTAAEARQAAILLRKLGLAAEAGQEAA